MLMTTTKTFSATGSSAMHSIMSVTPNSTNTSGTSHGLDSKPPLFTLKHLDKFNLTRKVSKVDVYSRNYITLTLKGESKKSIPEETVLVDHIFWESETIDMPSNITSYHINRYPDGSYGFTATKYRLGWNLVGGNGIVKGNTEARVKHDTCPSEGYKQIHNAAILGDVALMKSALESDLKGDHSEYNIDVKNAYGDTALKYALEFASYNTNKSQAAGYLQNINLLLDAGARVEAIPYNFGSLAIICGNLGDLQLVKKLVEKGVKIVGYEYFATKSTPLHAAASKGCNDIVEYLISLGHTVDPQTFDGLTPLYLACKHKRMDVIDALLRHKADPKLIPNKEYLQLPREVREKLDSLRTQNGNSSASTITNLIGVASPSPQPETRSVGCLASLICCLGKSSITPANASNNSN